MKSEKIKKILSAGFFLILMLSITAIGGLFYYALRSDQTVNIDNMSDFVTINGDPLGTEITETINLTVNTTTTKSYEVISTADFGFTINATTTISDEGLTISGYGLYQILPNDTTWINISYTPDLWYNGTQLTGTMTFDLE